MSTWLTDHRVFEFLFSAAPSGIIALDSQGRIVDCNASCVRVSGYDRTELIGRDVRELAEPASVSYVDEAFAAAAREANRFAATLKSGAATEAR